MPPRVKITKEAIINAAVEIVRKSGAEAINARNVAASLNCSTQPIFSNFSSMDQLCREVVKKADELCNEYISNEIRRGEYPEYKASGMAYIRFARQEKELFKLLYMRNRTNESDDELALSSQMESIVLTNTGFNGDTARLFHLEMWAYVHGIAVMTATNFLDLEWDLISKMLTDCYQGLKKQYSKE